MLLAAQAISLSLKTQIDSVISFIQQLLNLKQRCCDWKMFEQERDPLCNEESRAPIVSSDRFSGEIVLKNVALDLLQLRIH